MDDFLREENFLDKIFSKVDYMDISYLKLFFLFLFFSGLLSVSLVFNLGHLFSNPPINVSISLSFYGLSFLAIIVLFFILLVYVVLVNFLFLGLDKKEVIKFFVFYMSVPFTLGMLAVGYNLLFILMVNGWSHMAFYLPIFGFLLHFIFISEYFVTKGHSRLRSYFVMLAPFVIFSFLTLFFILTLFSFFYEILISLMLGSLI